MKIKLFRSPRFGSPPDEEKGSYYNINALKLQVSTHSATIVFSQATMMYQL